jgi:hypothetical protein
MEILKTLAVALSLGTLAGLNLYLTVFVTGLALQMDWVALPPPLHGLEVLGHPIVIAVAGVLYLVEFLADKVPWIDTAWDAAHTFIRPVGAAAIAVAAMGEAHPAFEVVGALLAGGMALSSHIAKSGTRLAVNASPEPFSNIGLSVAEDTLVLGGLALLVWSPIVALAVSMAFIGVILFFLPRLIRCIRTTLWFAWKKLNAPPEHKKASEPMKSIPLKWEAQLRRMHPAKSPIEWAVPCVSHKGDLVKGNIHGWLLSLGAEPSEVRFLGRTWRGGLAVAMDIRDARIQINEGFLGDRIDITHRDGHPRQAFSFCAEWTRCAKALASRLKEDSDLVSRTPGQEPLLGIQSLSQLGAEELGS